MIASGKLARAIDESVIQVRIVTAMGPIVLTMTGKQAKVARAALDSEIRRTIARARTDLRRAERLCLRCGRLPIAVGSKSRCIECLAYAADDSDDRYVRTHPGARRYKYGGRGGG